MMFFFAVAVTLNELVPEIKAFWPEPDRIHIDAWREVTAVDGYRVNILTNTTHVNEAANNKLFFINLGGYQPNKFEEQHYILLTVKPDRTAAFKEAKETLFFKHNHFEGANAHIDDKYGIDVDDLYEIEEILSAQQKQKYRIALVPQEGLTEDEVHLGYLKLNQLTENKPEV